MYGAYSVTAQAAYLVIRLAKYRGKKPGESMQEEFDAVKKRHPDWFQLLGVSNEKPDIDKMTGDAREMGAKVLNIHEVDRQAELKRKQKENGNA
jgi:hypothetical protein